MGFFGALAVQALQHGGAPQVFQQHETLGLIPGQDGWHTQTSSVCQCLNLDEGAAVFLVWWGIHDDQAAAVGAVQAQVAAKAGICAGWAQAGQLQAVRGCQGGDPASKGLLALGIRPIDLCWLTGGEGGGGGGG